MALNPDYIPMTPIWELFSDKDTGNFLRSGYAKFYRDTARTIGKTTYQITGSPPNYTYTSYGFLDTDGGWRIDLNDQGAFDSVVYGFPFDTNGNTDLYFIQFYSKDNVFQFSREGWPNFIADAVSPTQAVEINYIPNGQFRLHTNLPKTSNYDAGQVRAPITQCAFGGWTFERPVGSTARDFVTFKRFAAYTSNPDKSPRYEIEILCESPSPGDAFKDLRVKFDDVNKFADPVNEFTFAISGKIAAGGAINVDLILIKNFGTGGDPSTEIPLTTFSLTSTYQIFFFAFNFGTNVGKSIGILDDDYLQLALRFPVDNIYDVVFTDAILTPGNVSSPVFDDTTTRQFIYRSLFDNLCPNPDGSDLYLPYTLSTKGLIPDHSVIGTISAKATYSLGKGELDCDGAKYESEGYSNDGIPYYRLRDKMLIAGVSGSSLPFNMPLFGTGLDFLTADILDAKDIKISTNSKGSTSTPIDGSPATGFTFRNNHIGQVDVLAKGFVSNANNFVIISDNPGLITPGTFTIGASLEINENSTFAKSVQTITLISAAAGQYITFAAGNSPSSALGYFVWYKLDGVGTIPSIPGFTGIEVDFYSSPGTTPRDLSKITADAISGKQVSQITTVAASAIPAGSYFIIDTVTQSYYVWYEKDGVGPDPAPSGKIGIKVSVASTDTKDQVTSKTATAINQKYFAVPDLRGLFLRAANNSANPFVDLDTASRYANNSILSGNIVGSLQFSENIGHDHNFYDPSGGTITAWTSTLANSPNSKITTDTTPFLSEEGGVESRPQNIYVNYFIRY